MLKPDAAPKISRAKWYSLINYVPREGQRLSGQDALGGEHRQGDRQVE